jgi:hypothetical protein
MMQLMRHWQAAAAVIFILCTSPQANAGFSTSIMKPTAVGSDGVVSDAFPAGGKISYYFSAELQKGDLLTQISFDGRSGADKQVELALLGTNARVADSYWIHGSDAKEEATRSFPIDSSGRRILRITVQGPETGGFRLELGGSAFVAPETSTAQSPQASLRSSVPATGVQAIQVSNASPQVQPVNFSTTIQSPTPLDAKGVIMTAFPAGGKTNYYFVADVQPGELLTQISYQGREGSGKELEFALLNEDGRVADWYWIHGSEANLEATRGFTIEKKGKQVLRVAVQGPETGGFRVEVGGSAIPNAEPKRPILHNGFSRSVFAPTHVDESGVVSGQFPGNDIRTYYYFAVEAQKGDLLTQISYQSRDGAAKELELSVLGPDARVANWYWIHGSNAQEEATRSFPIDADGRTLIRVMVTGPETGKFHIELGGSALEGGTAAKTHPVSTSRAEF